MAKNKGKPIDVPRKTTIAENVEQLKPIAKDILYSDLVYIDS
jgi:hypothetical protein